MKNQETTVCRAVGAQSNYQKVEDYIYEVQTAEQIRFHKDFKQLSRKLQYFIIRLVKEHNRLKAENNRAAQDLEIILGWIDDFAILNYSNSKIVFHVTELYLGR